MSASASNNRAFSPREAEVYEALPSTMPEMIRDLGITESTIRDHMGALKSECGVPIICDDRGVYYDRRYETKNVVGNSTAPPELPGEDTSKAQHTKEKKAVLLEMKRSLAKDLHGNGPVVADGGALQVTPGAQDVVIHRSDDHFGAKYEDGFLNDTFNPVIAEERLRATMDYSVEKIEMKRRSGVQIDNGHLLMGGDHVHGEGIHENQPWESALHLVEQLDLAHDLYVEQIERLRPLFNHLQIVCQRGNHGELRGDGMSEGANADDVLFMMLEKTADDRNWDDVTIIRTARGNFTNFQMRYLENEDGEIVTDEHGFPQGKWNGHLRHGQNSLFHVGTSSGKDRWRQWMNNSGHEARKEPGADIGYRGHFHNLRIEYLGDRPIIMSGSICPPHDYEEAMASWSSPAATIHGVSDDEVLEWFEPIRFD